MQYSLFLYPQHEHRSFAQSDLLDLLDRNELISSQAIKHSMLPGERLMEYITFLGCSPVLTSGEIESRIQVHYFPQITGLGGESIEQLRYPRCKHPIANPQELLSRAPREQWQCDVCANHGSIDEINWRKSAAYADCFIEITSIFPKEAVPSAALLDLFCEFSSSKWSWFYSRSLS